MVSLRYDTSSKYKYTSSNTNVCVAAEIQLMFSVDEPGVKMAMDDNEVVIEMDKQVLPVDKRGRRRK